MLSEDIVNKVKEAREEIKMSQLSMCVSEVLNNYLGGEIILRPDYQRSLVWNKEHKDTLIESLVLGLPIPSIFVATTKEGKWEVVDGLQRLSTIIDFTVGLSSDDRLNFGDDYRPYSYIGTGLKYLPFLGGIAYGEWPRSLQLNFKRARLEFAVLDSLTSEDKKLDLFRRINQCGVKPHSELF